jgi:membrane protein implicated in regulation of membrane protease activity
MPDIGRLMVVIGLLIAGVGVLLWSGIGRGWLGQLPGDVNYQRGHFSFHFPIVTCLIVSAVLTFLMWLFRR